MGLHSRATFWKLILSHLNNDKSNFPFRQIMHLIVKSYVPYKPLKGYFLILQDSQQLSSKYIFLFKMNVANYFNRK